MIEILKIIYLVLGAITTALLVRVVLRSKQRLEKGMEEFQEELEKKGPMNPYLALAELYAQEENKRRH
ncbi:MAG TPA: hypothetical protein VNJ09_05160 [Chthonomonadales bacterium]|nr:hypothetical protein [Chthonomonadales bacterium]